MIGAVIAGMLRPTHVIDVDSPGWKLPYRVSFKAYPTGAIQLVKVEAFLEAFQIYKELTIQDLMENPDEYADFKDQVADWWIGEQFDELNRLRIRKLENQGPDDAA